MNVVPMDIKRQTFKKIFKGYDPEEVQTFLDMVSDQFDRLLKEKTDLNDRLERMQLEVEKYRTLEKSIQDTLESARRSTDSHDGEPLPSRGSLFPPSSPGLS